MGIADAQALEREWREVRPGHMLPGVIGTLHGDNRSFDEIVKEHLDTCPGNSNIEEKDAGFLERLRFLALALAGEAGEAANQVKKEWRGDGAIRDDYQTWEAKLEGEFVNVAQYTSMIAAHLDLDISTLSRDSFIAFEQRPEWRDMKERALKSTASRYEGAARDEINIEYRHSAMNNTGAPVPLAPLGSVTSRVRQSIDNSGKTPVAFRTSKETIEQLKYIGGVITDVELPNSGGRLCQMFMGLRIRAWGDYS